MCNGVWWLLRSVASAFGFQRLRSVAVKIGVWVSVFGVWWVSTIEIKDFWWVLGMWITGFQGSVAVDGGGGGGGGVGGGSFC